MSWGQAMRDVTADSCMRRYRLVGASWLPDLSVNSCNSSRRGRPDVRRLCHAVTLAFYPRRRPLRPAEPRARPGDRPEQGRGWTTIPGLRYVTFEHNGFGSNSFVVLPEICKRFKIGLKTFKYFCELSSAFQDQITFV